MNKDLNEEWFPMPEAAQYIGRSDTTVERLAASGLLESKLFPRPGMKAQRRYRKASLDSWLASRPAGPADVLTMASANRFSRYRHPVGMGTEEQRPVALAA